MKIEVKINGIAGVKYSTESEIIHALNEGRPFYVEDSHLHMIEHKIVPIPSDCSIYKILNRPLSDFPLIYKLSLGGEELKDKLVVITDHGLLLLMFATVRTRTTDIFFSQIIFKP